MIHMTKADATKAAKDMAWMMLTCGLYFIVIFLRVLFTTKSGQKYIEDKLEQQIKAFQFDGKEEHNE